MYEACSRSPPPAKHGQSLEAQPAICSNPVPLNRQLCTLHRRPKLVENSVRLLTCIPELAKEYDYTRKSPHTAEACNFLPSRRESCDVLPRPQRIECLHLHVVVRVDQVQVAIPNDRVSVTLSHLLAKIKRRFGLL